MTIFEDTNTPTVTEAGLQSAERELGLIFPQDYRRFLLDFNGGKPSPNFLPIPALNEKVAIDRFLGIGRPHGELKKWTSELRFSLDMPEDFIPIAFDPGGNSLIMKCAHGESPEVYYWDSARFFELSTDEENAFLVANSFSDLLTKFTATL